MGEIFMNSLLYFEQLEKIIYKCTLEENEEMINFLKEEEKIAMDKLTFKEKNNLLDRLFAIHPSLLSKKFPTDTLIIYQTKRNLPLIRLANILIKDILTSNEATIKTSNDTNNFLIGEGIYEAQLFDDCFAFRYDYIERIVGRILESKQIDEKRKNKIIKDFFFTYNELEEDKRHLHNAESADILAKHFDMLDSFLNDAEKSEVYINICLENMLLNIENDKIIGNKKLYSPLINIQVESLLAPLSAEDLIETQERFSYDLFNYNIDCTKNIYYQETEKVFKKLLINNVNK